jgi:putative ABC transport system permease protein
MDTVESIKMAFKTLSANRMRSTLTMLGMIIGNASVIAMIGVGQGAQRLAAEQFESLGPNTIFITPGSREARNRTFDIPRTLVLADADAIAEQVPTVSGVAAQIQAQHVITYQGKNKSSLAVGVTPSFLTVRSFEVARGRFISNLDVQRNKQVTVLGPELATGLFGDEDPIGKRIRIRDTSFQVVGVMVAKGAFFGQSQDDAAYIPISTMASRIAGRRSSIYGSPSLTFISITARDTQSIPAAEFQITNLLRLRHKIVNQDDFTVQTQKDILSIVGTVTGGLTLMLAAIAAISLLVGGIGIMNIMLVSVTERTGEIGLRKAIGASQHDILVQFMIEAVILSAAGGLLGAVLGGGGVVLVGAFTPLKTVLSVPAIVLAVGVSGGIGLFFGVVPAQQAARLDPIVALRSA